MENKLDKLKAMKEDNTLSIDEMEAIAGGTTKQCADDSRFLNVLLRGHPAQPERFGEYKLDHAGNEAYREKLKSIEKGWQACGIELRFLGRGQYVNQYYYEGKLVTQGEARSIAMENMGIHLQESDWKW